MTRTWGRWLRPAEIGVVQQSWAVGKVQPSWPEVERRKLPSYCVLRDLPVSAQMPPRAEQQPGQGRQ